ncbi:alkaline phosphatase [Longibacter salinarum]|uniref:Alkaline phosphatase n=2 Tax=Longibacter salinarum TaxID=1850348 RepID=A0A2A8CYI4_9BACT|nr:alkaline phosphatase [Longibacter salinarum]
MMSPVSGQPTAADDARRPTNVILFIPDGFGPASATMARDYLRKYEGVGELAMDSIQTGSVRTFSTSSRVTDSAAGATAYATGVKTYNGAIAVDTLQRPLGTLLRAAEGRGMATGMVVTSRITHATPASFSSHVPERWMENEIAAQQIQSGADVILGGGMRHFLPSSAEGSEREDDRNLIDEARAKGYTFVDDRDGLMNLSNGPVLGLFSMSHLDYEIDRDPAVQPSLAEMTDKALSLVSKDKDGYFMMVEASRVDHAGHGNDAAAHLKDIIAYNEAMEVALKHARRDGNTLVVSVSDHETGGLTLGRDIHKEDGVDGVYAWHPEVLHRVEGSHGAMFDAVSARYDHLPDGATATDSVDAVAAVLSNMAGIDDLTDAERASIQNSLGSYDLNYTVSDLIERRAVIGWTTRGHTAVDVNLYAYGPGVENFRGNMDNTEVGDILASLLNLDLDALTADLREETEETQKAEKSKTDATSGPSPGSE